MAKKIVYPEIPKGGCKKTTPADVVQIFDAEGNCIKQYIICANEDIEYCDRNANILEDHRTDFYFPFNMEDPKAVEE